VIVSRNQEAVSSRHRAVGSKEEGESRREFKGLRNWGIGEFRNLGIEGSGTGNKV